MEATLYMFGWMVLLGIAYGVREGAHIGVDVWVKKLPPRGRRLAGLLGAVACIGYAVLMLIGSASYLRTLYTLGVEAEDLPIQRWVLLLALPLGFGLLLWRLLELTWRIWSGQQTSLLADEAAQLIEEQRGTDVFSGADRP
jgi:C4-dicarboxylate transporter DctQ subunit